MIPQNEYELENDAALDIEEIPTPTPRIIMGKNRLVGSCDGLEAIKQAVYLILNVERYRYVIYSSNYGVEFDDLLGKPVPYVLPELKRRIEEALTQDDRITSVDGFEFKTKKDTVHCTFTVHSIFGNFVSESVVNI